MKGCNLFASFFFDHAEREEADMAKEHYFNSIRIYSILHNINYRLFQRISAPDKSWSLISLPVERFVGIDIKSDIERGCAEPQV